MTLAVRWGEGIDDENSGFIYFDAVTVFTQNYSGQITKHPIDVGASITDHYIKENPVFTLSGVVSGVDVSTGTYLITDLSGNSPYNTQPAPNPVSVTSTDDSVLRKLIPSSIGQFLPDSTPEVYMDPVRASVISQVRDALIDLTSGTKLNEETGQFDSFVQLVRLYEYEKNVISRVTNNLVITNVAFKEDVDTGQALYCDITFEQVTFAYLKKTDIPKDVQESVKKKASPKKSTGKCDSTVKDTNDPGNTDPDSKKTKIETSAEQADIDPTRTTVEEINTSD